mmetsp:Transcript_42860/g.121078  ORF Transcript_42860/g.121078 Transcript_42860/m.121078 type:complete len:334 (+) Transcript_42860:522-1523(+)
MCGGRRRGHVRGVSRLGHAGCTRNALGLYALWHVRRRLGHVPALPRSDGCRRWQGRRRPRRPLFVIVLELPGHGARAGQRACAWVPARLPLGDAGHGYRVAGLPAVHEGRLRGKALRGHGEGCAFGRHTEIPRAVHLGGAQQGGRSGLRLLAEAALRQEHPEDCFDLCQPERADLHARLRRHHQGLRVCEALGARRLGRDGHRPRGPHRDLQHLALHGHRLARARGQTSVHSGFSVWPTTGEVGPGVRRASWQVSEGGAQAHKAQCGPLGVRCQEYWRHDYLVVLIAYASLPAGELALARKLFRWLSASPSRAAKALVETSRRRGRHRVRARR